MQSKELNSNTSIDHNTCTQDTIILMNYEINCHSVPSILTIFASLVSSEVQEITRDERDERTANESHFKWILRCL